LLIEKSAMALQPGKPVNKLAGM